MQFKRRQQPKTFKAPHSEKYLDCTIGCFQFADDNIWVGAWKFGDERSRNKIFYEGDTFTSRDEAVLACKRGIDIMCGVPVSATTP